MGMMNQHALKQRGGMWSNVHEHKKKFPLKKLAFNTLYVHLHSSGITDLRACSYLDFFCAKLSNYTKFLSFVFPGFGNGNDNGNGYRAPSYGGEFNVKSR